MSFTVSDAAETKSFQKQNDATSHALVAQAYDPKAQKGVFFGDSADKPQVVSNGHVHFGDVAGLYGTPAASDAKSKGGAQGPTEAQGTNEVQVNIGAKGNAITGSPEAKPEPAIKQGAINPNPEIQKEIVDRQKQPLDPKDIGLPTASAAGVEQTTIGDCYFESALASVANTSEGKTALQNMIKTNTDGSYTVTFPGDTSNPVNVTTTDLTTTQGSGQVTDTAKWARIAQTAFLKYDSIGPYAQQGPDAPVQKVADSDSALHLLTGQSASTDSLAFTNNDTESTLGSNSNADVAVSLTEALKNGDPVTASTGPSSNNRGGLEGNHVFSVLSYDPKTDKVLVRNPWGNNGNPNDKNPPPLAKVGVTVDGITSLPGGNLEMSLNTFTHSFSDVNFAGQTPLQSDVQNVSTDLAATVPSGVKTVSDLTQGNLTAAGTDFSNFGSANWQVASDGLYAATSTLDQAENLVSSAANAGERMVNKAYQDVTSFFS